MKPAHIILRPRPDRSLLRDHNGQFAYALVDYELLERTPEHEQAVRSANRQLYLKHMARRFEADAAKPMPAHLHATNVLGVDYIFGRAESTGGLLWVVGKDPDLFNVFPAGTLAAHAQEKALRAQPVFLHAHQGQHQSGLESFAHGRTRRWLTQSERTAGGGAGHGFNSPFEEFAFALEMGRQRRAGRFIRAPFT